MSSIPFWIDDLDLIQKKDPKENRQNFLTTVTNECTGMPVPSACSKNIFTPFKFFCACSIFFEHSQIFWSWSKARFYLINLHIWAWSKIFEHIQKILNTVKNIWTGAKNIWTSRWIRHESIKAREYMVSPSFALDLPIVQQSSLFYLHIIYFNDKFYPIIGKFSTFAVFVA